MTEPSPLPPRRRDTRRLEDVVRQDRMNLKQLGVGFVGGRFPPARPLPPGPLAGDDEDDAADDVLWEWEWDDRHTVTTVGTQQPVLSHAPVDEALVVRWHPKGRGALPVTNESFSVDGNNVTIVDPGGLLAVGDQFSFQYPYDPDDGDEAPDALRSLAFVGKTVYYSFGPHPTSFALPAGTAVGDLIVVGGRIATSSDSRLTSVGDGVWVGRATDLSDVLLTNTPGGYWAVVVAVYRVNVDPSVVAELTDSTTTGIIPSVAAQGSIVVVQAAYNLIDGAPGPIDSGYVDDGSTGTGKGSARVSHWIELTQPATPAATCAIPDTFFWVATTIGFV